MSATRCPKHGPDRRGTASLRVDQVTLFSARQGLVTNMMQLLAHQQTVRFLSSDQVTAFCVGQAVCVLHCAGILKPVVNPYLHTRVCVWRFPAALNYCRYSHVSPNSPCSITLQASRPPAS